MEKVTVKYTFRYSDRWDEDTEMLSEKPELIKENKDGTYTFIIFPPTEDAIKRHAENTLGRLVEDEKIDFYRIISITNEKPDGRKISVI